MEKEKKKERPPQDEHAPIGRREDHTTGTLLRHSHSPWVVDAYPHLVIGITLTSCAQCRCVDCATRAMRVWSSERPMSRWRIGPYATPCVDTDPCA